jgi:hypothetical protein
MQWEYRTVQYNRRSFLSGRVDPIKLNMRLNELGRDGWELVNVENMTGWGMPAVIAVFKRQL